MVLGPIEGSHHDGYGLPQWSHGLKLGILLLLVLLRLPASVPSPGVAARDWGVLRTTYVSALVVFTLHFIVTAVFREFSCGRLMT